jgi:VanZ like family
MYGRVTVELRHLTRLAQFAAWASLALIAYLTLMRVGLVYSIYYKFAPLLLHIGMGEFATLEHLVVFALFGSLLCAAYPRHILLVCCIVFVSAVALELMQTLTPDRHGTLRDAVEKIAGGACGIFITKAVLDFWYQKNVLRTDA